MALPEGELTMTSLRQAMEDALAALPAPLTLDDVQPPTITRGTGGAMPLRGGQFSILFEGDQQYVEVTCDGGRAFTVGPAGTAEAAIDNGLFGLRVCANPAALAEMSLPETGVRWTRAQLEAAMTAALAVLVEPLAITDLQEPPSGREDAPASAVARSSNGSYTTWSVTTWGW